MRQIMLSSIFLLSVLSTLLHAQAEEDPTAVAEAQGACALEGIASAVWASNGTIEVTCADEPVAFVPLLGGLAPLFGAGAAVAVAAAVAGGNSTPNTQ